jgi:hypothetical protein
MRSVPIAKPEALVRFDHAPNTQVCVAMLANDAARQPINQAIRLLAVLAFSKEWAKQRQQSVFAKEAVQSHTWLAGEARSERFKMGWDNLVKREVGFSE